MKLRFHNLLSFMIYASFIPVSFPTPFGFVSPVDIIILVALIFCAAFGSLKRRDAFMLSASFACFVSVVYVQILANGLQTRDVSTYIKYAEFFVFLPLIFASARLSDHTKSKLPVIVSRALRNGGLFLSAVCVFSAFTRVGGLGHKAELYFIGFEFHKNFAGALLLFGASGAAYLVFSRASKSYWPLCAILLSTLLIEARASFLIEVIIISTMYAWLYGAHRVFWTIFSSSILIAIMIPIMSVFPIFDYYFERMASAFATDTSEVTSSTSRLLLWQYGIAGIVAEPFVGHGWGNFAFSGNTVIWLQGKKEPHNVFIQVLYSGGLMCLVPFCVFFYQSIKICLKRSSRALFGLVPLGYFFAAQFGPAFVRGDTHLLMIMIMTAVYLLRSENR